ncbi:MAG: PhnD/SsuA/transferrin family substrate-binding protein [Pseudomonadota bacterium]
MLAVFLAPVALAAESPLRFAPLPMEDRKILLSQYEPFLDYLHEATGEDYDFRFYQDYGRILESLWNGEVDLAYLGPLPYVRLTARDDGFVPLVTFLNEAGEARYTCSVVVFAGDGLDLGDLAGRRVALTQPYSTCGYLVTESLLREAGIALEAGGFDYTGSHSEAILSVVRGSHAAGGAKTSIVEKFAHLGVVPVAESDPLPGFLLVANPSTTTEAQRERIRQALVGLDPADPADRERLDNWGESIRHGAIPVEDSAYDPVRRLLDRLPDSIPGIDR